MTASRVIKNMTKVIKIMTRVPCTLKCHTNAGIKESHKNYDSIMSHKKYDSFYIHQFVEDSQRKNDA